MKTFFLFGLLTCILSSCSKMPYQIGYCEIYYQKIEDLPSKSIQVVVTDRTPVTMTYKLNPSENRISIPLEAGDTYKLKIDGVRTDSIYNVLVLRSDDNRILEYYSFMFNNTLHNSNSNIIRIDL